MKMKLQLRSAVKVKLTRTGSREPDTEAANGSLFRPWLILLGLLGMVLLVGALAGAGKEAHASCSSGGSCNPAGSTSHPDGIRSVHASPPGPAVQSLTGPFASPSTPNCGSNFARVSSPSPGVQNQLLGIAVITSNDGWAVGNYSTDGSTYLTLAQHWNGTTWSTVPSPNPASSTDNNLAGVAAISSNDVWAVGQADVSSAFTTLAEHWNGTTWNIVSSPNQTSTFTILNSVAAISSSDVWAVGSYNGTPGSTLTEHWNGAAWGIVPSPNVGSSTLTGVKAVTSNDVWAVGYSSVGLNSSTLTEHWNGAAWSIVPSPNMGTSGSYLEAVAVLSSNDVWSVGYSTAGQTYNTLTEHWNGTAWSIVLSPSVGSSINVLDALAIVSSNDVWAVGYYSSTNVGNNTLAEHWNGTAWSIVPSDNIFPYPYDYLYGVERCLLPIYGPWEIMGMDRLPRL